MVWPMTDVVLKYPNLMHVALQRYHEEFKNGISSPAETSALQRNAVFNEYISF